MAPPLPLVPPLPPFECIVSGAGATGLALALGLAQAGIRTALLGVPQTLRDDARSAALFNASLAVFDALSDPLAPSAMPGTPAPNLGTRLREAGAPLCAIRMIDATGAVLRAPDITFKAAEIGQRVFGYNIVNAVILEQLLAAAKAQDNLTLFPDFLEALTLLPTGEVRVTLSGGAALEAQILVGADGQNSATRDKAKIGVSIKPYPQSALTARFRHSRDHNDTSTEFHTREGPFTLVPMAPGMSALVWLAKPDHAAALHALAPPQLEARMMRQAAYLLGDMHLEGPTGLVPMRLVRAHALTQGPIALVGEAAHAFPPIGAQGLNLGLQDVKALSALLVAAHQAGTPLADTLPAYARARAADIRLRALGVDLMNTALIKDWLPLDLARAASLGALARLAPLRALAMRIGGWTITTPASGSRRSTITGP